MTLALVLGLGLLIAKNVKRGDIAELSEDDFEFGYVSSLAYSSDTEQTSGGNDVYGWGYKPDKDNAEYAYITKINNEKLTALQKSGVTKLVINIPAEHGNVPVAYVAQDAFNDCTLSIVDINMPLSVHWQIKGTSWFELNNNSSFARADGLTATFTGFKPASGSGVTTLILPSNVWIDEDSDGKVEDSEPKYRYTEYLFQGNKNAPYTNLVVMPDVVNIFNGENGSSTDRPKMQGGLLSKSEKLESVFFCTGRSEVLHLYPLTFENCTALKEISLSAGVYLEDGARVFQGSSALEKFSIADEKTASAPLFYMVGADGALYTNNYSYSYYNQSSTERYYEWWKKGQDGLPKDGNYDTEWVPTKAWDSETAVAPLPLSEPENPAQKGTFTGDKSAISTTAKSYYATKDNDGKYDSGIGIPEGSYVFDVNGKAKSNGENDTENDFATGTSSGQYAEEANFKSKTLTTIDGTNTGGTTASISVDDGGGTVKVTEKSGANQSAITVTINDVEYKSHMQLKRKSERYLVIEAPFDFELTVYFAGSYSASEAGIDHPQMGLFDSGHFNGDKYKSYTYDAKKAAPTAKLNEALATLKDADGYTISTGADHLLKIERGNLKSGKYYIAQPADDPNTSGESGAAQMLFLVITPSKEQTASSIVVEQNVTLSSQDPDWQRIQNDALIFQKIPDTSYFLDLQYPIVRYDKTCEIPFRVKALTSAGENLPSQDIGWEIMDVNGNDVHDNFYLLNPATAADKDGYFTFTLKLEELFEDSDFYGEGQHKQGKNFAIRFTAGDVTKYIFINLLPEAGNKDIPDVDRYEDATPQYLNLIEENSLRYQTLISMPAKAKSDDGVSYINSFEFSYHETVEIGPNAFQNTYITVIRIPDRIAKIGASAFRFSDHLQTVYLPDAADIGLNAFGQEPDASPQDKTVYTAGKQNFFLIAPSRTSFEQYLKYAAIYEEGSGQKELEMPNYNVFPVHAEENEGNGFEDWGGKDPSYDYTPYLTYEIEVNFLTYDEGGSTLQSTETRTFLYGMDAHYVKATATTEWAKFDEKYDNNAPVWFGRIKETESGKIVQQINTLSTEIAWSVAADGWYYDDDAALPAGNWYFGNQSCVTESSADGRMDEFTKFIGGWAGGHVNGNDIQNLVQVHYQNVMDYTSDASGITKTGQKDEDAGDLRPPVGDYGSDDDNYYTTEFEKQTRWNRYYWEQKLNNDDGAIVQRFFTMPFSITLKSKEEARESRIDFDVPTFQNIGEITYGEDTVKAAPKGAQNDTWNVPMLTVTFDYNGFPASRIFENFKSSAMKVEYKAWRRNYNDKAWRWYYNDKDSADWSEKQWDAMKYSINDEWVPYDAGYYKITLSFESEGTGEYTYYWSGIYNGMRVDANADSKATFTFILNIQPRKVPLSNVYSMQYSGLGFSLFEDNPYIDVMSYGDWSSRADYTAEGLPCAVGRYLIKLKLHDPKYPSPNESSWSDDIDRYTPNLEWEGAAGYEKGWAYTQNQESNESVNRFIYTDGVELFILDGDTEVSWGMLYDGEDDEQYLTFTESLATFGSEVITYTYTGAPISLEEVFGGVFSSSSIEYTIERNGSAVSEIKDAGTYQVSITPAEGYVWWRGIPSVNYKATFHIDSWSLDDFWAEKGGYEGHERMTLTFEVFVDKRIVTIPRDSYVPKEADPPYEFEVPIGGDYEVMGYHEHDFSPEGTIPKAGENSAWSKTIFQQGVYDVLIRLTDPANTTWASTAGESHGDNYYIVARLYAGFDREKDYPTFNGDLGDTTGNHASDKWVELTHIYDGNAYGIDGLFEESDTRPTDHEATYTIYHLPQKPESVDEFSLLGEEVEEVKDAGYYGIAVLLNDPFYFKVTEKMSAYYLVHIEKAEIKATFALANGKATYDGSDRLTEFNDGTITFTTVYETLTAGVDYNVIIADPVNTAQMVHAGTYTVKVELTSSDVASNYELTEGQTEYTIDSRPLTLDLGTITGHTYLDAFPEEWHDRETLTFEGETDGAVVSGDDLQLSYRFKRGESIFPTLDAFSDAGDYTVEVLCGNTDYTVTLGETHYTIKPLTLTLKEIEGVTYDKKEHKPNISFTGEKMVLTEGEEYELTYAADASSGAQLGTEGLPLTAGSYTVTVKLLSKNYTFAEGKDSTEAEFTIEKARLSAPYLLPASFPYTGEDVRGEVTKALHSFDPKTMAVAFSENEEGTDVLSEVKEAGTYYVKVTLKDANYAWEEGTDPCLSFTVSQTAYDMSGVTFESKTFTYDGKAHSLSVTGLPGGISVEYSDNSFVDVGTYTVTATFTVEDNAARYEAPEPMTAQLIITEATIAVEWEEISYTYTGSELPMPKATAHGAGDDGEITLTVTLKSPVDGQLLEVGEYTFEAAFASDYANSKNYILAGAQKQYTVAKATYNMAGVTFENGSFEYDGTAHSLAIGGSKLPKGVDVEYTNNRRIDVGEYEVTATFKGDDAHYEPIAPMTATLTVTKATITARWEEISYTYTGSELSIPKATAHGAGDEGEIKLTVTLKTPAGEKLLEVGEYTFEAAFASDYEKSKNYILVGTQKQYTVAKATYDMAGVTFEDAEFLYDGEPHSLSVGGSKLPDGVSVEYAGNGRIDVGEYEVWALFTGDDAHYEPIAPMKATLTVKESGRLLKGISFADGTFTYDGKEHSIYITGTPGEDVTVTYDKNGQTEPGTYTVTATFSDSKGKFATMSAQLTITKAVYDMTGVTFGGRSFEYDGTEHSLAIGGSKLPEGVSVEYTNNGRTDVGDYEVTATFKGDDAHYEPIAPMTATLTVTKATISVVWEARSYTYTASELSMPKATAHGLGKDGEITLTVTLKTPAGGQLLEVGEYTFGAAFASGYEKSKNYILVGAEKQYTVAKATYDMAGVTFEGRSFEYDGTAHSLAIGGSELPEGVRVTYTGNGRTDVGEYEVWALFTGDAVHYEPIASMTATLTVTKQKVTMPGADETEFVYTGEEQTYAVAPSAAYTVSGNRQTNANETGYQVNVALNDKNNCEWADGTTDDVTFLFRIAKATVSVTWEARSYTYTASELPMPKATVHGLGQDGEFVLDVALKTPSEAAFRNAGDYTFTATLKEANAKNYTLAEADRTYTVAKATVSVTWEARNYTYAASELPMPEATVHGLGQDGEFVLDVALKTPSDAAFQNAGDYTFTAALKEANAENYVLAEAERTYTVAKATVLKPGEDKTVFVYTGEVQTYTVAPNTAYTVSGNQQTNANETGYQVNVVLSDKNNYEWADGTTDDITFLFRIAKADYDMSGVTFPGKTVGYDGEEHSISIEGELPEGVRASYEGNGKTDVGDYRVTVSFTGDTENYHPIPSMHATLSIRHGYDFNGITFENVTVKYDGEVHGVYIQGELPEDVSVVYEGNEKTEPGVYAVKAIFSNALGKVAERTAVLTILRTHAQIVDADGDPIAMLDSEDGFDPTLELVLETSSDIARTVWAWEKDYSTTRYTVKFIKDGVEVPFDGKVTVRLLIPEGIRGGAFTFRSVGRAAEVEYTRDGNYIVFEANGLSTYEFTCSSVPYLPVIMIAAGVLLAGAAMLVIWKIVIRKKKKGE